MKHFTIVLVLLMLFLTACGSNESPPAPESVDIEATVQAAIAATQAAQPFLTDTPLSPTSIPLPADTPTPEPPTATPVPEYAEPVTLLEMTQPGNVVTDNFELPLCQKAVFYWSTKASEYGTASLILRLLNADTDKEMPLVNEMAMDVAETGGSAIQALAGGNYYFAAENTSGEWSVRLECQDRQAPAAQGMDVAGDGSAVTPNYELSECQKSVFNWSTEPNASGTASIIVKLVKADMSDYAPLVNEMGMDQTVPLEGSALQPVSAGLYFLVVENTSGPWSVKWECRD